MKNELVSSDQHALFLIKKKTNFVCLKWSVFWLQRFAGKSVLMFQFKAKEKWFI